MRVVVGIGFTVSCYCTKNLLYCFLLHLQILMNMSQAYITVLPILYASIQEAALSVSACLDSLEMESLVKVSIIIINHKTCTLAANLT